jgi:hypothetical protein
MDEGRAVTAPRKMIVASSRRWAQNIRDSLELDPSEWDAFGIGEGLPARPYDKILVFADQLGIRRTETEVEHQRAYININLRNRLADGGVLKLL